MTAPSFAHTPQPLGLQNLFALRNTTWAKDRHFTGRVFFWHHALGLVDHQACLWPLQADPSLTLHAGDIVVFQCRPGALLELTRLVHHTPCQQLWHNAVIPDPLPQDAFFATHGLVPPLARPNTTLFFPSPTALRLEPLRNKNRAWDRTKQFFTNRGFVCIETPTLVPSGGVETYLHPFATIYQDHQGRSWPLQLPTSPEFALKKVLSETLLSKVFQLSRAYRNHGELSKHHEPEFVMLEWYRTHASLHDLREDTQKLVGTLAQTLGHSALNLPSTPWPVFRVDTLFQNLMGLSLEKLQETPLFYQAAKNLSPSVVPTDDWDSLFYKLFFEKIEPFLKTHPGCFVTHYPIQMAALAAPEALSNRPSVFAERMEAFLYGVEIANAYQELTEPLVLKQRFAHTLALRPDLRPDVVFEDAMDFGLPPCAGIALGWDRLIAVLLGLEHLSKLAAVPFLSQFPKNTVAPE